MVPIWEPDGQLPAVACDSPQRGTPPSLAKRPFGRWIERVWGLASPSWRVRVMVKGEYWPANEFSEPACKPGLNPPFPHPWVICIGASPCAGGRPDQGAKDQSVS